MFRRLLALLVCLAAAVVGGTPSLAQPYPSRPIRLVLSVGTGGVGDVTNRLFAQHMSQSLGPQIVVDNRPSGGGIAAAMAVIDANPDGYTLLQAGNGVAVSAALYNTLLITSMRGNELQVAFELLGPALSYVRNKSMRALAVGSARRFAGLPDVPTIAESGVPGYDVSSWTGISVPAKTPSAIVDRLAREVARAAALPEVKRPLQDIGIEARASTPEETRKRMAADIARWRRVVEQANIERQ